MNTNYTTLNKDIGLVQRSNNGWDLWFENGDTVKADDFHSLQTGIILACLTSWNYLNRYGNPTYETFGNRAYELLKENKSSMVAYKIQQYFIECLKRMRRVYEIVYLEVSETPSEPYKYLVEFEVISVNNQLVNGSFNITTDTTKSTSYIEYTTYMPYASNENPLIIDLYLKNEYGGGLGGEILYMYIQKGNGDYQFMGVVGQTDENGYLRVVYEPTENNENNVIYFDFQGNTNYNPSTSERTTFKTELYEYYINFINNNIVNNEIATYNDYANLKLKLRKKSLLDKKCYDVENTPITVIGDGLAEYPNKTYFYNAVTDANGEATIRANIEENTLFTTSYNNSTSYVNVTIIKQNPTITFTTNKSQLLMGEFLELRAIVKDEFNNYIKNYEVIFKDGDEIIGSATTDDNGLAILSINTLLAKTYSFTANTNSTNFYEPIESDSVSVTIDKHIPTVEVSVEEPPLVVGNDIMLTALVTEVIDETVSNLFNLSVKFTDENNEELDTVLCSDGVANLLVNGLSVGEHTITATVIENDYYVSRNDSVTFTIIDHNYDMSLNVQKTNSTIENNNIRYMFNVAPIITDNGFSVNHLNMENEPIIISCNDTDDEWTVTEYVKDETLFSIPYVANDSETVTFTANWGEIEVTEEFVTPYWEDYCVNDSTNSYQDITFAINSLGGGSQVVSNELCKNNWTIVDGYTVTNSSIRNNGVYEPIHYTATQPISIDLTPIVVDQWSYGEGFFCGVKRKHNDDFDYETDLEGEGHGFSTVLDTGDELWVRVDSSQQVVYEIWTVPVPSATLTYDSSQQSYLLSSDDTGEMNIAKAVPNVINSNNIKLSCKVKLTSDSSDDEFILGLTDSKNFETNQYDYISITGNGGVNYVRRYNRYSDLTLTTLFEENIYETFEDTWVTLELEKTPDKIIGKIYDENNELIASTIQTSSISFNYIFISTKGNGNGNYVKDIEIVVPNYPDYDISFERETYHIVGNSGEIKCLLSYNGQGVENEAVYLIDGINIYKTITDNNGIGTFNVANLNLTNEFQCIWGNKTDECIVQSHLFYDTCDSSDRLEEYNANGNLLTGGSSSYTFAHNNNDGYYTLENVGNSYCGRIISQLNNQDNISLRIKFKYASDDPNNFIFVGVTPTNAEKTLCSICGVRRTDWFANEDGTWQSFSGSGTISSAYGSFSQNWHYLEISRKGTSVSGKLYDENLRVLDTFDREITVTENIYYFIGESASSSDIYIDEIIGERAL